jgi:hypothetical protein
MTERDDAQPLEISIGELAQEICIDVVDAEGGFVLLKPNSV